MEFESIIRNLPAILAAVFLSVLFIQSGLDKVFDWKGNLGWLSDHFSKTILASLIPILLAVLTLMEIAAGVCAAIGVVYFFLFASNSVIFVAATLAATTLIALFSGQRLAKDYAGAAVLVPYFLLACFLMFLTNPFVK